MDIIKNLSTYLLLVTVLLGEYILHKSSDLKIISFVIKIKFDYLFIFFLKFCSS